MIKKIGFILFILMFSVSACSSKRAVFSSAKQEVVLEATPFKVKGVTGESVVDAVEEGFAEPGLESAVVLFKIDKIVSGEFTKIRAGGDSRFQQMKDAARDKDFIKLLKSDFTDPNEMIEQKWVSIAVSDPKKTFGFETWGTPKDARYKLYLQRIPEQPNSYILVKSQLK